MEIHNYDTSPEELKDCPFCGNRPYWFYRVHKQHPEVTIGCKKCNLTMTQSSLRFPLEWLMGKMVESWNTRVIKDD